ncbi:hypothetical protein M569_10009 [Genlisea aurea]|uniref:Uncharacterized protein n=1 Tax=Genlisea aurea TaxID=192259 RepID=S8CCS8_9LAMI|nr:hypothetical protein M569_10009 [Genlisea aurea]
MKSKGKKLLRLMAAPYRAFRRARDFYVRSMIQCANMNAMGLHLGSHVPNLPRSYSMGSSRTRSCADGGDDDFKELVRTSSCRRDVRKKMPVPERFPGAAMGRIDEESACYHFGCTDEGKSFQKHKLVLLRSKSVGTSRRIIN